MRRGKLVSRLVLALLILAVAVGGIVVLGTPEVEAKRKPCICPLIYDPVICKGGRIFSNQCLADCRKAKDCVPLGDI